VVTTQNATTPTAITPANAWQETANGPDAYSVAVYSGNKLNCKVTSTHESVVSQDGRTLTDTSYAPGQKKPVILVFEKQM